ncbi:MAG: replication-associated recombination protein A [Proteobacteria bacterium]|nr:replication-associated recombination protein A [Pseudomonadota bacterium]
MAQPQSLFEPLKSDARPLADRLRPQTIDDIVGQDHLLGTEGPLRRMVEARAITSLILWGPPGCGKTTLARILAEGSGYSFVQMSAIFAGVADLRRVFEEAKMRAEQGKKTLLFVDEIHRFNKSQQDAFLPHVEDGTILLVGATTENPSFELNAALLSRCAVFILNRLDDGALERIIARAEAHTDRELPLDAPARAALKAMADGDGRYMLNLVEQVYTQTKAGVSLTSDALVKIVQKRAPLYDKKDEGHYNLISALHKSVRGSDPDAALYWFCRMLDGGEDPRYIARRLVRMATEDIGLASPQALPLTIAAWDTYERLGSPEGELALAEALLYLATAPKSNASYVAYNTAKAAAKKTGSLMPPKHILNAPTKLMKEIGYGAEYVYDPDTEEGFSGQNYFPDGMQRETYYTPKGDGFEKDLKARLSEWAAMRAKKS